MYRNHEHYPSPTEGTAFAHIEYEERKAARLARQRNQKFVKVWSNPKPTIQPPCNRRKREKRRR